jgi:hypothetical protein
MKSVFIIALCAATIYASCKNDSGHSLASPTSVVGITGEQAIDVLTGVSEDTCGSVSGTVYVPKPKPTNDGEEKADEKKLEKIKEDLEDSNFNACPEIITEYQKALEALKKGNTRPISEFPESTDPKIALCIKIDTKFAIELDSLRKEANRLLDTLLKANDKF